MERDCDYANPQTVYESLGRAYLPWSISPTAPPFISQKKDPANAACTSRLLGLRLNPQYKTW